MEAIRYCLIKNTRSVQGVRFTLMVNIVNGSSKIPCEIDKKVDEITKSRNRMEIHINHIIRGGNKLSDYIANLVNESNHK